MPTLLITGPERSGKTSVAAGLPAWLRGVGRTAAYCKPFSADGGPMPTLSLRPALWLMGWISPWWPAPRHMSAPLDACFIDLLRSEAETIIVEAAAGSTSSELAGALDSRVLEV